MNKIVTAQKALFQTNATKNIVFRIEQLKKLEYTLKENEQLLNEAIFSDFNGIFFPVTTKLLTSEYVSTFCTTPFCVNFF